MARMKRVVNRYGKITLGSLGGFLVTIGAFLIVLSSATVSNVARADECEWFDTYQPYPWGCVQLPGHEGYCCQWVGPGTAPCSTSTCENGCASQVKCTDGGSVKDSCDKAQGCGSCYCKDADPRADHLLCECA
jgi:hypothetical protein